MFILHRDYNISTLLDVILVNSPNSIKVSGVAALGLSDHRLVYALANKGVKHHEAKTITCSCRSTKHLNEEELNADMPDIAWPETQVAPACDPYLQWKERFMKIIDKHLPVKKIRIRKNDVPYMNAEWPEGSNKKENECPKKFSKDRTRESWELMKTRRNRATQLRRRAIKDYWNGVSGKLDENPKKFFGTFMPFISSNCAKDKDSLIYL